MWTLILSLDQTQAIIIIIINTHQQINVSLLQLKKEIDSLKTKIADLNRKKEELLERQTELNVLWDNMGLVVDEAARRRTQERKSQRVDNSDE